jgi:hypothetical protein
MEDNDSDNEEGDHLLNTGAQLPNRLPESKRVTDGGWPEASHQGLHVRSHTSKQPSNGPGPDVQDTSSICSCATARGAPGATLLAIQIPRPSRPSNLRTNRHHRTGQAQTCRIPPVIA